MVHQAQAEPRRGAVSPFVILGVGAFFAAVALAVDTSNMWNAQVEMRNATDASVLAAAQALVDDDLLLDDPSMMAGLIERARQQAVAYAQVNPVAGRPLKLDPNLAHQPLGDIVFGHLPGPRAGDFQPAMQLQDPHINAVRIIGRCTRERGNAAGMYFARMFNFDAADVVASTTAYLDRDVIGFRPRAQKPLPLIPLAVLSDPSFGHEDSWEQQVVAPAISDEIGGDDQFAFDRVKGQFRAATDQLGGDRICEMTVHIPLTGQPEAEGDEPNGCLLQIGDSDWIALCRQIAGGVSDADLKELGGQFCLGFDNCLPLGGNLQLPGADDARLGQLLNALKTVQMSAQPRVWPLFSAAREEEQGGQATIVVQGFVAARLAKVELSTVGEGTKADPKRQELTLTLQPCMMATSTAITDARRRDVNPAVDIHNRYICKVRLVE